MLLSLGKVCIFTPVHERGGHSVDNVAVVVGDHRRVHRGRSGVALSGSVPIGFISFGSTVHEGGGDGIGNIAVRVGRRNIGVGMSGSLLSVGDISRDTIVHVGGGCGMVHV